MLNLSGRELVQFPDESREGFGRARYLEIGMALMLLKYAVDAFLVFVWAGEIWTPLDYVLSLANLSRAKASRFSSGLTFTLLLWTVPFVWTGVVLSVRRIRDAALPLWLIVLFFIPVANYFLMLLLALWPTAPPPLTDPVPDAPEATRGRHALSLGTAAGLATGLALGSSGTLALESYGLSIFIVTPFISTATAAFIAAKIDPRFESSTTIAFTTLASLFITFILVAIEGFVCLLMATPLIIPIALLGGLVGHALARTGATRATIAMMIAVGAGGQAVDAATATPATREVLTAIDIAAPPDAVWRNVVSFAEIRTPPTWLFRTGLAYPLRARIDGRGVGAVRHCEFTTGAFVEPITAWDEPRRLAFDVVQQPPALREWSPYRSLHPPHLDGFFRTSRGEFRLAALPGGGTRLEGRTWYTLRMEPQGYWTLIADAILHRVHARVLDHIKQEAEAAR